MTNTTAPEVYTQVTWTGMRVGDVLMHANGDRLTVTETFPERLRAAGIDRFSERWEQSGFIPYRKQPELPNETGAYIDKDGDYWLLDRSGNWHGWSLLDQPTSKGGNPQNYAPFTRLTDAAMALLGGSGDE